MINKNKHISNPSKKILLSILLGMVLLVVAGLIIWRTTGQEKENIVTANSNTKGEPLPPAQGDEKISADESKSSASQPQDNKNSTGGGNTSQESLLAPDGTFVSNHHPTSQNSSLQSNCTTTPGATCQIILAKDGVTKTLDAQVTDRGGSTYWSWDYKDIGLTSGSWTVQAKATLGSQVKTSDDTMKLEVQ